MMIGESIFTDRLGVSVGSFLGAGMHIHPVFDMHASLTAEEAWLVKLQLTKGNTLPRNFERIVKKFASRRWVRNGDGIYEFRLPE